MCCSDISDMASAKLELTETEPNPEHYFSYKHALLRLELQHRQETEKTKQKFMKETQGIRHRQPTKKATHASWTKSLTFLGLDPEGSLYK